MRWLKSYPGRGSHYLQDVWVSLLQAVEGSEEGPLDAEHVLLLEVGVVSDSGVLVPQQAHEAGCHHERAELHGAEAWRGASCVVRGASCLLQTKGDLLTPSVGGHLPGPLGPFCISIFQPQKAYLLQYVYGYLTQGHEGNNDYVRMNPAATQIIRQGLGVCATQRLQPATTTQWATTKQGARIHAYQPRTPCRLPCPDDHNTVILADASGPTSLTPAAGGAALELRTDGTRQLRQHHLTGATIFGASSHEKLKTLAVIVDAINDTHQQPRDHAHHVWVIVDAAVDFQIFRQLARQPLHKASDLAWAPRPYTSGQPCGAS